MSTRLPWPLVFQVLGVVAGVWLVIHTWQLWLLGFTALVVAAAVLPAARFGERYKVPRGVTVLLVYLGIAALLTLMGRLLWPVLRQQALQFIEQLPRLVENLQAWLGDVEVFFLKWGAELPTPRAGDINALVGPLLANTLAVTAGVFGAVVGLLAVLVIAAYVVIDAERIGETFLALLPERQRKTAAELGEPLLYRIGGYVRGQTVSSLFVGALIAIGLGILGVPYALLLGALAAVLNVVPFVGAFVAGVLAVLSALSHSLGLAIGAGLLFWAVQLVEGKFLAPHFVGRATGLHPLAVLLGLLAGAHLAGLVGVLVAIPLVAAVWESVRILYLREHA